MAETTGLEPAASAVTRASYPETKYVDGLALTSQIRSTSEARIPGVDSVHGMPKKGQHARLLRPITAQRGAGSFATVPAIGLLDEWALNRTGQGKRHSFGK